MNTFAKFLFTGSLALAAIATTSFAHESDPSYDVGWAGAGMKPEAAKRPANRYAPEYLRPTQRYYGKGFTVAYRFVPWSDRMRSVSSMSMWDSDQMRLPVNSAAAISSGNSPRVTYFHRAPATSAAAPAAHSSGHAPADHSNGQTPADHSSGQEPTDHSSGQEPTVKPVPSIAEPMAPAKP